MSISDIYSSSKINDTVYMPFPFIYLLLLHFPLIFLSCCRSFFFFFSRQSNISHDYYCELPCTSHRHPRPTGSVHSGRSVGNNSHVRGWSPSSTPGLLPWLPEGQHPRHKPPCSGHLWSACPLCWTMVKQASYTICCIPIDLP